MSKMIQIRHVSDEVHSVLKERAAEEGMSLSDFLSREITKVASRPPKRELLERIQAREPATLIPPPEQIIREMRDSR